MAEHDEGAEPRRQDDRDGERPVAAEGVTETAETTGTTETTAGAEGAEAVKATGTAGTA
ncbi:hypothetical protein [Streptosporangium sp. NPDC002524]|uniref:hypothetical protein n=1 Tax=Streptosporangium sp. NPDC002524 TaxID=3154537 RepID=UPI0033280962